MAFFIVIPTTSNSSALAAKIEELDLKNYKLPQGEWMVAYDGTSKELSGALGITSDDSENGNPVNVAGIVVSTNGHWGYTDNSVWEWINVHG